MRQEAINTIVFVLTSPVLHKINDAIKNFVFAQELIITYLKTYVNLFLLIRRILSCS